MGDRFLEAGKITGTHGVGGEVRIFPWADSPGFLLDFSRVFIDGEQFELSSARIHKSFILAAFKGVDDLNKAIRLKNRTVFIDRNDVSLGEGCYFIADLIGLNAIDADSGEMIGVIADVISLPGNDVYIIQGMREILIPAVDDFVKEINTDLGFVKFLMLEGL